MIKPPRKRSGRPALDPHNPPVTVSFRLPLKAYDRLCQEATVARCSLPEHLRRVLTGRRYLES